MKMDVADVMVLLGMLLLGGAIGWTWGIAAACGLLGCLLIIFGVVAAAQRGRRPAK
jgi:hypothetical protein